jgi:hypothetical protein
MTPELITVSPNSGSIGGTKLYITAPGVGPLSNVSVTDASGNSICESLTVVMFGQLICVTKPMEIDTEIKISKDGELFAWK